MKKYLITATMEYYTHVDASSDEEALALAKSAKATWRQTINEPLRNIQIHSVEQNTPAPTVG